ncbi:hypothetical protein QL285_090792 [Trifolium repens]|nr:hypothetical protein QL285_090789 [Trifolium repens]KAK2353127.1 hypothetical protein QL285_090792 [Trifolium repens]
MFPSASKSLFQVIFLSKIAASSIYSDSKSYNSPGELQHALASSPFFIRRFCHVIIELVNRLHALWRVPTSSGELLLALACLPLFHFDALCLYSPCTRSGVLALLALASSTRSGELTWAFSSFFSFPASIVEI